MAAQSPILTEDPALSVGSNLLSMTTQPTTTSGTVKYPALASPTNLGAIQLRNRVVMGSLTRYTGIPGQTPNEDIFQIFTERAKNGVGLINTQAVLISGPQGYDWAQASGIYTPELVQKWKRIIDSVHAQGCSIVAQLWHMGRQGFVHDADPSKPEPVVYAPSAIPVRQFDGESEFMNVPAMGIPTPIENPKDFVEMYRTGAENAKLAGFDGVELHVGSYLPSQFLDSTSNVRADSYGGSVENRCRFTLEATAALCDVYGADRVGIKVLPAGGYGDQGMPLQETLDTFSYLFEKLDQMGLAYIQLVRYMEWTDPPYEGKRKACVHDVLKSYKPFIKNTKIIVNGDYEGNEAEAEKAVEEGVVDAVAFSRAWYTDADYYRKLQAVE